MTNYKVDITLRFLVDSARIPELTFAADYGMTEPEAIRRMFAGWFNENILPTVKQRSFALFNEAVSTFDAANAKVELD